MTFGRIWLVFVGNRTNGTNKLTMCTVFKHKVEKYIISKIKKGEFEYLEEFQGFPTGSYGLDDTGKEKQIAAFKADFAEERYGLVSLCLKGGYIDHVRDGKEYF